MDIYFKGFCCENNLKFLQIYFSWVYNKLYILQNWGSLVLFSPFLSNSYLIYCTISQTYLVLLYLHVRVTNRGSWAKVPQPHYHWHTKRGLAPCPPKHLIQPTLLLISEWLCCFISHANTEILRVVTLIYFKCSQDHLRVWRPPLQRTILC